MKAYKITIIVCLVITLLCSSVYLIKRKINLKHDDRSNTECTTDQRIFDYNDVLTSNAEDRLLNTIEEYEDAAGIDIVIVTLDNDTDFSYIEGSPGSLNHTIQYFTEVFTDYYRFGWEKWEPVTGHSYKYEAGTSVVIAANWDTGDAWMCTSGRALERIDDSMASEIVQDGCEYLRENPEKGFEIMLDGVYRGMMGSSSILFSSLGDLIRKFGIILAFISAILFFLINYFKRNKGKNPDAATYARGGNAQVLDRRDMFIRKNVTSVRINTDSGSHGGGIGGGGGHSGGGHHGGGGGHF